MIIVSQNKKNIINFNNICKICVNKWNDKDFTVDCLDTANFECMLGEYKTEERAKRVLKEITKIYNYANGEVCTIGEARELLGTFNRKVYEMPLE